MAIYALADPLSAETRYIGQSWHPMRRYEQHLSSARVHGAHGSPKDAWIASLLDRGVAPCLLWLDWVWAEDAERAEREQIADHQARGCALFNGPAVPGEPVVTTTTIARTMREQIAELAAQWDVSLAAAMRRLLAEALSARAAAAASAEERSV